jgi:hypothetical protein
MIVTVWPTLTDRRAHHLSGIIIVTVLPPSRRGQTVTIMDEPPQKHTSLRLAVPARSTPPGRLGPSRPARRGGQALPTACRSRQATADCSPGTVRPLLTGLPEPPGHCRPPCRSGEAPAEWPVGAARPAADRAGGSGIELLIDPGSIFFKRSFF